MDALARNEIPYCAFIVERGEDRSLRPCARNVREDALGASALV
jgi:hypothetical protein